MTLAGDIQLSAEVKNIGQRQGSTVIQVYLRDPVAETSQPVRRLVAYQRVDLAAEEQQGITIQVPRGPSLHPP